VGLSNGQGGGGTGAGGRPRGEVAVRVGAGRPAASGGLSAEQIQRVVRQNASAIRYCYEAQVQRRPNLRGQISIGFSISQSGSVSTARVASSSMGSPDVEGCIVRVFRRMRFPQSESGDSRGTYPFNFSAGG
jgi:TonB family protein